MDVQAAVSTASTYLRTLYGGAVDDVLLEEVERKAGGEWLVTLSFARPGIVSRDAVTKMLGLPGNEFRLYKVFTIDSAGNVSAMKIRQSA